MLNIISIVTPVFIFLGLSQLYAPKKWIDYYRWLEKLGLLGFRLHGVICLILSVPIIVIHNVWSGPSLLLTITGWVILLEGISCIFFSKLSMISLSDFDDNTLIRFLRFSGVYLVVVGGVLFLQLLFSEF